MIFFKNCNLSLDVILYTWKLHVFMWFCWIIILQDYKQSIVKSIEETWSLFEAKFISLWNANTEHCGDAYLEAIYNSPEVRLLAQQKYIKDLFHDSLGYGAAKMIRSGFQQCTIHSCQFFICDWNYSFTSSVCISHWFLLSLTTGKTNGKARKIIKLFSCFRKKSEN